MTRVLAAAFLAFVLAFGLVGADAGSAHADCAERLEWIDARLSRTARRARIWAWSWGSFLAVSTVGSLVIAPFVPDEEQPDYYVNAVTSGLGLVPLVIMPLEVMRDGPALRARMRALPEGADRCALLAEAELMLARDAEGQAAGRAWWNHALNVAVNGGAGLFLGLVYDRWQSGILAAVVGTAVGEIMIFTQPVDSIHDLHGYRATYASPAISLTVMPMTQRGQLGLVLRGSF